MKAIHVLAVLCILAQACYGQLANTAWPMFRHDLKHSATSPYHDPASTNALKCNVSGGALSSCAVGSGGIVYVGVNSSLYAINGTTGAISWTCSIGDSTRSSPAIASDGTIYIGSNSNYLYAINPTTHAVKWSVNTTNDVTGSPAVATDGKVYVGSRSGRLYSINASGSVNWYRSLSDMHMTSPAIGSDGTIYVGGSRLWAINPNNTEKWSCVAGGSILTSPALSADGTRIYFGCGDGNLYCVNTANGSVVWTYDVGYKAYSTPCSPAVGPDGSIFVGSNWGPFYCIAPNGTETWRYDTNSDIRSSPAVNANGTVFFGTWDGFLYALNPNGTLKWRYLTKGSIYSSPAIDAEGDVWIPSWDGYVYGNLNHTPTPANPPAGLTATLINDTDVRLDWTDNSSDEYGFAVYRKQAGHEYVTVVGNLAAGTQTYTDPGLQTGTVYYYQVAAYQEGGFSYSNEQWIKTPGLEVPTDVTATQLPGVGISVSWTDNAALETGYKIERKAGNLANFREIATLGIDAESFTDTSVNPATDYYYRIRAFNLAGNSSYSDEVWCASEGRELSEISLVSTTRPQIALTFDAGTEAVKTSILDTMRQYNVRCTFFVAGMVCENTPAYWQQAVKDGHQVCSHTYDHPNLIALSDEQMKWEMDAADAVIYGVTGCHSRPLFRPPYGSRNQHVIDYMAELGYRSVYWSDACDGSSTQDTINRTLAAAQNGAVILYHCTLDPTASAMPTIVPQLLSLGYELVTVSELVAPLQVTSPPEAIFGPRALFSVPIEPAHASPLTVFGGAALDYNLLWYDNEGQGLVAYDDNDPVSFGGITPDYGYWVNDLGPLTVKVNGSTQMTPRHIMLPHASSSQNNWTVIGYPFLSGQLWSNCMIYNPNAPEPKTRSIADADAAGWIYSVLLAYDSVYRGLYDIGLEEDAPTSLDIEPWHGYWLRSFADDLQLIIPPP